MSWVEVVGGALTGISNFFYDFGSVLGGALTPATVEGIVGLFFISIILRIVNGGYRKSREELELLRALVKKKKEVNDVDGR